MFDIDGTLVDSHGFDGDLFAEAVRRELGVRVDQTWQSYRNHTDSGVLDEILRGCVPADERQQAYDRVKACFVGLVEGYIANQAEGLKPIPGAPDLIARLRSIAGVVVAVATGGWRETAELKLRSVGIAFEGLPFATCADAAARTEIMQSAERRASVSGRFARRTYFGDAPWDKRASADLGYDFVAIGDRVQHPRAFENLTDQEAILDVLGV